MNKTVIVTVAAIATAMAAGNPSAGIRISLNATTSHLCSAAPYEASFADVAPGDYELTAQAEDEHGQPIGSAITQPITIAPEAPATILVDLPQSISATLS